MPPTMTCFVLGVSGFEPRSPLSPEPAPNPTAGVASLTLWNCSGAWGPECQSQQGALWHWVGREPWYDWVSHPGPENTLDIF